MAEWCKYNLGSVIILIVLIAIVALIVAHMIKKKIQGKPNCSCGCTNCAMQNICHRQQKLEYDKKAKEAKDIKQEIADNTDESVNNK